MAGQNASHDQSSLSGLQLRSRRIQGGLTVFSQDNKPGRGKQIAADLAYIIRQIEDMEPLNESVDLAALKQLVELARIEAERVDSQLDLH